MNITRGACSYLSSVFSSAPTDSNSKVTIDDTLSYIPTTLDVSPAPSLSSSEAPKSGGRLRSLWGDLSSSRLSLDSNSSPKKLYSPSATNISPDTQTEEQPSSPVDSGSPPTTARVIRGSRGEHDKTCSLSGNSVSEEDSSDEHSADPVGSTAPSTPISPQVPSSAPPSSPTVPSTPPGDMSLALRSDASIQSELDTARSLLSDGASLSGAMSVLSDVVKAVMTLTRTARSEQRKAARLGF